MKVVWSGLESSGKSLKLSVEVVSLVHRNSDWYKKSGIKRPILSNMYFSKSFYDYATSLEVPILYWENLDDLVSHTNCDVLIDELGNYFDSRMWQDLSLDVRRWLTQGAKSGIEIYGTAQDFAQVDKSFRRLVNNLYMVTKVIGSPRPSPTKPPVKRIWGVCMIRELDPVSYSEDDKKFKSDFMSMPTMMLIEKKYCDIFDTTQKIKRSKPPLLRHEELYCSDPDCKYHKVVHT